MPADTCMTLDEAISRQSQDRIGAPSDGPTDGGLFGKDTGYTPAWHIRATCDTRRADRRADHRLQAPAARAARRDPSTRLRRHKCAFVSQRSLCCCCAAPQVMTATVGSSSWGLLKSPPRMRGVVDGRARPAYKPSRISIMIQPSVTPGGICVVCISSGPHGVSMSTESMRSGQGTLKRPGSHGRSGSGWRSVAHNDGAR
jgi:hypothetical protein